MTLLLDTHVVLWALAGEREIGPTTRKAIRRADALRFSVVSFAEIGVKVAVGKLDVPDDLAELVHRAGIRTLGLTAEHGLAVAGLPLHHRDPFDRLLVAQARAEGMTLVTADERITAYDVATLDPTV
ncbi:MAG: type II toxin-antitoxin system VapC family toxin [Solirubrobacteraceae bacterium]